MKTFHEWLENRDPECYEEGKWIRDTAFKAALLAGTTLAGAGLGSVAPHVAHGVAGRADTVGGLMGIEKAGELTRAKESARKKVADKVGGDASYGAMLGLGSGMAALMAGKKRKK